MREVPKAQDLIDFPVGPLRPIIMLEPFEMGTLDYTGPFEAVQGHSYILVLIENMLAILIVLLVVWQPGMLQSKY